MVHVATGAAPGVHFANHFHLLEDSVTGLSGAIAIDSTALGPAAGGCRFWRYARREDLHADAVRLAQGMTYKNALAGLPFGGGKAVLQVPEGPFDRRDLFRAFGRAVDALKGRYVTAEDVGTAVGDMRAVAETTRHVAGRDARSGRAGGDPSPWTGLGVFLAIEASARIALGADLSELCIAVQGAGNVGAHLVERLVGAGARVVVSDIDRDRCARLARRHGVDVVAPEAIAAIDADVYAPCALGGALTEPVVAGLKARLVCGGANNQIAAAPVAGYLLDRGITYVPDYVANAGGIINVAAEYLGETTDQVATRVRRIPGRVIDILRRAEQERRSPAHVADAMARDILRTAARPWSPDAP
jgi:leucine dehydrogenase